MTDLLIEGKARGRKQLLDRGFERQSRYFGYCACSQSGRISPLLISGADAAVRQQE
ncbi:MAG TPA: hypothetical protein VKA91_01140 [Nitrososphaeraceae archaeon]|nr:hypothetical protein [Nitrososphaeraceae archaeon]